MNKWLGAAIAIAAALLIGSLAARLVRNFVSRPSNPRGLRESAGAIASLVFSLVIIAGLITALGLVNKDSLDTMPEELVKYTPRVLSAAIVLIAANVVSAFAANALERSMGHVSPAVRRRVPTLVKAIIFGMAGLIAANQIGVDTTIITLAAGAVFFSVGLASAMIAGLGSRTVSAELAAGRALRQLIKPGDVIAQDDTRGELVKVHAVATELLSEDGSITLIPNSMFLDRSTQVVRADAPESATD